MPVYIFKCTLCGDMVDKLVFDKDQKVICMRDKGECERVSHDLGSVQFKGSHVPGLEIIDERD